MAACASLLVVSAGPPTPAELELIQPHKAQKQVLRGEVGARALRVRSVSREEAWASAGVPNPHRSQRAATRSAKRPGITPPVNPACGR